MKLGDICPAPCFVTAADFVIPRPGCERDQLEFEHKDGRRFYAIPLRNHPAASSINPRIAIVGLSPAGNQIEDFLTSYRATGSYELALINAAFAGLASDIIGMFKGIGLAQQMGLKFPRVDSLAGHPEIYATSLVACASLTSNYSSDDFEPAAHEGAHRCASHRFLAEVLNPSFSRLSHVFILGKEGWAAVRNVRTDAGFTILETLRKAGKTVLNLPHPSGQNREYVQLASLSSDKFPTLEQYVSERWAEYALQPPRRARTKQSEAVYRKKRATYWITINELRKSVAQMDCTP